jgi:peroxin-5
VLDSFFISHLLTCLNLGLNIGAYKESAEHFLSALSLQEMTNGDTSDQLWQTLRRSLDAMVSLQHWKNHLTSNFVGQERSDLAEVAQAKGSLDVFRREGFDF